MTSLKLKLPSFDVTVLVLGVVRFVGDVEFAEGTWFGVELLSPKGKNDGTVQGKQYFSCKPNHGLIVRPSKVRLTSRAPSETEDGSVQEEVDSSVGTATADVSAPHEM